MKKLFFFAGIILIPFFSQAQFNKTGNGIYFNSGNVGIGTSNPTTTLTVNPQGYGGILIGNPATDKGGYTSLSLYTSADRGGHGIIQGINSSGTDFGYVLINPNGGNVGIGTANPGAYKLAVNGSIRAKEIQVETGWADFVFAKNYKLTPLSEVEKFISENGHLPAIPSATEVEKNGIQLGEMVKLQMMKIEELTLYVIQLQNKIQALEAK